MHGFNSGTACLVNVEFVSMGGLVDAGVGIDSKASPRQTSIEKAQSELRQEFDVLEEQRKELEFLENGGNPLDFKFGHASAVSVQSTSPTEDHLEEFVTSEAKGSFALAPSPHENSIESIGRTGVATISEPNTADNLLLFDNVSHGGERNSLIPNHIVPPGLSSQIDENQNSKELEISAMIPKNQAYARRNRSKSNRGASRSSFGHRGSSISIRQSSRGPDVLTVETNSLNDHNKFSICNTKPAASNGNLFLKSVHFGNLDKGLDTRMTIGGVSEGKLDIAAGALKAEPSSQQLELDAQNTTGDLACSLVNLSEGREQVIPVGRDYLPSTATVEIEHQNSFDQLNGFKKLKRDRTGIHNDVAKGLDSESSCTHINVSLDATIDDDFVSITKNPDSNENPNEQPLAFEQAKDLEVGEVMKEKNVGKITDNESIINIGVMVDNNGNDCIVKVGDEIHSGRPDFESNVRHIDAVLDDHINAVDLFPVKEDSKFRTDNPQGTNSSNFLEPPQIDLSEKDSCSPNIQSASENNLKMVKERDDFILEDAQIIQAKRKRITELSVSVLPFEIHRKIHWDFVLEEMSWLANDFSQERLWKTTAAAQVCHHAYQSWSEKQALCLGQKKIAHSLAKAVSYFWHSAELRLNSINPSDFLKESMVNVFYSKESDSNEVAKDRIDNAKMETNNMELQSSVKNLAIERYAVRFLKNNGIRLSTVNVESPLGPDKEADTSILETSWEQHFAKETLFYIVPPRAMEIYRESIESHMITREKMSCSMQEVETSMFDAGAENVYGDFDGETDIYCFPGVSEHSKRQKFSHKRKNIMKSYPARLGEFENKGANKQYGIVGRSTVGSIPTKRMRTASRQRVLSPFSAGPSGSVQAQPKTDVSSGDTSSLQDDLSTLHGGSQIQKSLEVESMTYEKQLAFDYTESSKPKQKKTKYSGLTSELRWQFDSGVQSEQRDQLKRRSESHQFESIGNTGMFGQRTSKKQKVGKHSFDNFIDVGLIPSPAGSQMSKLSNSNKIFKMIGGRDRGKKSKGLKIPSGQSGSGSPWSLFEDQALVVLVHDMGPNWELVSDCMNSTLQLKCIFRMPKECKERHKILMDRTTGDGVDSAEDSGSSQPYPSTLPGIPKGSARQLFQRLQGPMEEETLKSHFENIISIVQKQHYQKLQFDKQEVKVLVPVDNSHKIVLSHVCSNNLNGTPLTPLDLIDAATSNSDAPVLGHQGCHTNSSQGPIASMLPAPTMNSPQQGSCSMTVVGNLSSPPTLLNGSARDTTYGGVPRASTLPEEQQKMQHYNQILSARNVVPSTMAVPATVSGPGRGVRLLPGGNGMGMMCGMNRGTSVSRTGLHGISSSSMLNAGSMIPSSMMVMPTNPVNVHSRTCSAQGNSLLRPRDAMHLIRPGHAVDHQRQIMVPEMQMQPITQGTNQVVPPFSNLSSVPPSSVQPYRVHSPQRNPMSPQHQAHANRLAKEMQMQQRSLQHQQIVTSNPLIPSQTLTPISSSPLSNGSQVSVPLPLIPSIPSSSSLQHLPRPQGLPRQTGPPGVVTNQVGKPRYHRQQPPQQQFSRNHPQPRQSSESQPKHLKAIGRGNILIHQNLSVDSLHLNNGTQGSQGQEMMHHGQGGMYSIQSSNQTNQTQSSKLYSTKQQQQHIHLPHPVSETKKQGQVMQPRHTQKQASNIQRVFHPQVNPGSPSKSQSNTHTPTAIEHSRNDNTNTPGVSPLQISDSPPNPPLVLGDEFAQRLKSSMNDDTIGAQKEGPPLEQVKPGEPLVVAEQQQVQGGRENSLYVSLSGKSITE